MRDSIGGWIGEVDLAYAAYRIAIEYHGDVHRAKRRRWQSDVAKVELLHDLRWTVIVITAEDLEGRPERILARVRQALVEAGHPGIPSDLKSAWRTHLLPRWVRDLAETPEGVHRSRSA